MAIDAPIKTPTPRRAAAWAARVRSSGWIAGRPGVRCAAAVILVALLPVACASHDTAKGGTPVAPGESLVGNYLAGRHAQAERDIPAAVNFLAAALEKAPENRNLLRRTFMLMAVEGHIDEAMALARRLVAKDAKSAIATMVLVVGDIRGGRFEDAERRLQALPPKEGMNVFMVPLLRAWTLVGLKRNDAALEALQALGENKGFQAMLALHTGLVHEVAGHAELAEKQYLKAAETPNGLSLRLVELLGALYARTGQADKAKAIYRKYMEEHPTSQLMGPALARLEAGGAPKRPVKTAADGAAEALFGVSNSIRQRTTQDAALVFGRLALALKPDFPLAQILVADILEIDERLERANAIYAAIDRGSPFAWSARLSIAANLNRMDRTEEAVKQLHAMAKEIPTQPDSLINLGDILRGRERFEEAVAAYDQAFERIAKLERRHWTLLYARGIALERSKKWLRAEADFLKALEFEPEQPYVLNYLGYSWIDRGRHLKRAKEMIEKAVKLRPNDGYIVDSMGWILYRLGDFEGAARELERAVELRPQDPIINDHLGDAYWKVERRQEARFQWRRALGLDPEPALRTVIESKLKHGLAAGPTKKAAADE